MSDLYQLAEALASQPSSFVRRKCFISYYGGDTESVRRFLQEFGSVFIPKVLGVTDMDGYDNYIDSNDTDYVMSQIRKKYLGDSTVTILLIGTCTHSRRYIDWELKSSLRQGQSTPNGLLGILLPHLGNSGHLPERFLENYSNDESKGYALYRSYPSSKEELSGWIEQAFTRRTSHAGFIKNSQSMPSRSSKCKVCSITH